MTENTAILKQFRGALQKNGNRTGYLYLSIGDEPDGLAPVKTLHESLKKYADKNLIWYFKQYSGEDHFSVGYQSMYDGLKFIYSKWYLNPRDASMVKSYEDIRKHLMLFRDNMGIRSFQMKISLMRVDTKG